MTPERKRRLQRIAAPAGVGLGVFAVTFAASFPYDRIRDLVTAAASRSDLDVEIAEVGPTLGVGLSFGGITVSTRPVGAGKPTRLRIDEARVLLSPLWRILGQDAVSVSAQALGGDIDVDLRASKAKSRVRIGTRDIALADLPGVKEAINLPLAGALTFDVDLATTGKKLGEAAGQVSWTCAACAIGDGKAKLKVAGNPLLAEGLGLPRLRLGDLSGSVVFEKGVGKLKAVQARSPDGELRVEGEIRLADPLALSRVDLYITFRLSEPLLKSADKLQILLQIAEPMGKRPDGMYGLQLAGTFGHLGPPRWAKSSPFSAAAGARSPVARPGLRPSAPSFAPSFPPPPAGRSPSDEAVNPALDPTANMPRYPTEGPLPAPTPPTEPPAAWPPAAVEDQ